jgi:hypothetical protein
MFRVEKSASEYFSNLKKEATLSSETPVVTRAARRHIPEDGIPHCHRRENLNFYIDFRMISTRRRLKAV